MTREELIQQAATDYEKTIIVDHFSCDTEIDFSEGARWADANRWVSVEDGLPECEMGWSKQDLLIQTTTRHVVGRTRDGSWIDMSNNPIVDVTHWQYITLPEPPKAEQ